LKTAIERHRLKSEEAPVSRQILVIDDEERLARSLTELLREEGYEVDAAVGGEEGLRLLREKSYHLIITDLRMPGVDGLEVMDFVSHHLPGAAIIVITGHATTHSAIEAIHNRVADYITKPFELDMLIASIEKVFAQAEAEQMRQDMVRMITHDIKVPLNSILGFASFIVDRKTGAASPQAKDYCDKIIRNCQRIVGLLDNYLAQARAESGKLEILPQPINLTTVVEDALRVVHADFERRGIHVDSRIEDLGTPVMGDEHLLFRAVCNLMNNAAKYSDEGGQTRFSLTRKGSDAVFVIENTGPGIPPNEVPYIFQRYRRSTTSRGIEGSGLGLFVVDQVARAHNGSVTCECTPEAWTRFTLRIPIGDTKGITDGFGI
jgi:signal transduction histidine kinase